MPIGFDDSAANHLIHASYRAASLLRAQSAELSKGSASLFVDFKGPYATRYHRLREIDAADRMRLAFALEELSADVAVAKAHAIKARNDEVARPPLVDAIFTPQEHLYTPLLSSRGGIEISSARPSELRGFASSAGWMATDLSDHRVALAQAWQGYLELCSWSPVGIGQFIDGFEDLVSWNFADLDWLGRIAEAFEAAGKSTLLTSEITALVKDPTSAKEMKTKLLGMSRKERHYYIISDEFRAWSITSPDAAKKLLDSLADNEYISNRTPGYRDFIKRYWTQQAMDHAGIDPSKWDPEMGTEANQEIIDKVYAFYADLYLANEDLKWSGMATLIGPSFVGGFKDLAALREIAQLLEAVTEDHVINELLSGPWGIPLLPGGEAASWVLKEQRALLNQLANVTDEELKFIETTFLIMQKEIFMDQGLQHVAYTQGGVEEIDRLTKAVILPREMNVAWRDIDSGEKDRVWAGNNRLLYREQNEIIPHYYNEMREYGAFGEHITWRMTLIGQPSIPGAKRFPQVYPVRPLILSIEDFINVDKDNPLCQEIYLKTGFPDGNISRQQDRWRFITEDTLPAFYQYETESSSSMRQEITRDFDQRVEDVRFLKNMEQALGNFINDFELEYEQCSKNSTP